MADRWPVTLAGIRMDNTPDVDGIQWRALGDIEGWDDSPVREDESDLTGRHGGFGSDPLYGARLLTLAGRAHSPTIETAWAVKDRLLAAMPLGAPVELIVHEPVPKSLIVRRGRIRCSLPGGAAPYRVTFQVPLTARTPFKRGLTPIAVTVSAGATVNQSSPGTVAADLIVKTTSAGTVKLTAGGLTLTTTAVPAGTVIDTAACTVTGPGGDLYTAVAAGSQWPVLPAGGGPVKQAGTADLDITFFDTYA